MKAIASNGKPPLQADFYTSTLAPVNQPHGARFRALDAMILIVLFLELAVVARLVLAN
ncbi:MAG TPA: hypothetical protein VFM25_15535 [Verrucomicrobiae bacterium]|jgi:hypothetical protein|nr:hypothetical protein [Verrucomicrobiae bacterium]